MITGEDHLIEKCKQALVSEFEMKDLGILHYFLGLEVWQHSKGIFVNQGKYTLDLLNKFGMLDSKAMKTPMETNLLKLKEATEDSESVDPTLYRQIIGSLMYLVNTRPDICYAVNVLSQFMCKPKQTHLVASRHILRYLSGTIGYGLKYTKTQLSLRGYTYSYWV